VKLLLDMNLAPEWVTFLSSAGLDVVHWSAVGVPGAKDVVVMGWAREHERVVVTHDLGFSALLALSRTKGPSVVLLRRQDVLPASFGGVLVQVLRAHAGSLDGGAILSVDETSARVRILPLGTTASDV